jgi:Sulfate permease family
MQFVFFCNVFCMYMYAKRRVVKLIRSSWSVCPQFGLYSAYIGSIVYTFFGSSKDITLGPSAISSLLTAMFASSPITKDPSVAIMASFLSGFVYLGMFIFGLGLFRVSFCWDHLPHVRYPTKWWHPNTATIETQCNFHYIWVASEEGNKPISKRQKCWKMVTARINAIKNNADCKNVIQRLRNAVMHYWEANI